jgi:hypothetical protein
MFNHLPLVLQDLHDFPATGVTVDGSLQQVFLLGPACQQRWVVWLLVQTPKLHCCRVSLCLACAACNAVLHGYACTAGEVVLLGYACAVLQAGLYCIAQLVLQDRLYCIACRTLQGAALLTIAHALCCCLSNLPLQMGMVLL